MKIKFLALLSLIILSLFVTGCNPKENLADGDFEQKTNKIELSLEIYEDLITEISDLTTERVNNEGKLWIDEDITIGDFLKFESIIMEDYGKLLKKVQNLKAESSTGKEIIITLEEIIQLKILYTTDAFDTTITDFENMKINEYYSKLTEWQYQEHQDFIADIANNVYIPIKEKNEFLELLDTKFRKEFNSVEEVVTSNGDVYFPFEPITLGGIGGDSGDIFYLKNGLTKFRANHIGESNFIVYLYDVNGNRIELIVNEIGSYSGEKLVYISNSGDYYLDVTSDGKWGMTISDPNAPIQSNKEKIAEEEKEIIPWETFLEECQAGYAKTIFLSDKQYYTDVCEKEYAIEFNLPEYCEKLTDLTQIDNCWATLARHNKDDKYCDNLEKYGDGKNSMYKDCKNRVLGLYQV